MSSVPWMLELNDPARRLPPDSRQQPRLVDGLYAERPCLFQLAARVCACDDKARCLADTAGHATSCFLHQSGGLSPAERRQCSSDDDRHPSQGTVRGGTAWLGERQAPVRKLLHKVPRRRIIEIVPNRLRDDLPNAANVRDLLHGRRHDRVHGPEMTSQYFCDRLADVANAKREQDT